MISCVLAPECYHRRLHQRYSARISEHKTPIPPYNSGYFGGCLHWNMYWDFGSWQVGDMGSHTMDLAWNAIDAGVPTSAEAHGDPVNPDVAPSALTMTFEHPANDWRPAIQVTWYQGANKPNRLEGVDVTKIGHGALFVGDKAFLLADFGKNELIPRNASRRSGALQVSSRERADPRDGRFSGPMGQRLQGQPENVLVTLTTAGP